MNNYTYKKPYAQHPNIFVKCMWDNLKLKNEIINHEVPLYLTWLSQQQQQQANSMALAYELKLMGVSGGGGGSGAGGAHRQQQAMAVASSVLTANELKALRKPAAISSHSLAKLFEQILRYIKENDVSVPFRSLLEERVKSKVNFSSAYRDMLFLASVALEREFINNGI